MWNYSLISLGLKSQRVLLGILNVCTSQKSKLAVTPTNTSFPNPSLGRPFLIGEFDDQVFEYIRSSEQLVI